MDDCRQEEIIAVVGVFLLYGKQWLQFQQVDRNDVVIVERLSRGLGQDGSDYSLKHRNWLPHRLSGSVPIFL